MSATSGPAMRPIGAAQRGVLRLKPHVDSFRHVYQGQVWYVFHDRAAHRYYRISGKGAEVIGGLDGRRGLEDVLAALHARDPENAPDPRQVLEFIHQLNALDLLQSDAVPDVDRLDARHAMLRRRHWLAALRTPLSLKVPLLDPTSLLDRLMPWTAWMFSPIGALLWLIIVGSGAVIGLMYWNTLARDVTDRLLTTENLVLAGCIYPLVKVLHELGHGVALRRMGAEVRQIGVLFAAFIPVPYVDASAAAVLERRRDRIIVDAAGILVEMFLGGIALIVWSQSEASTVRAVCYNVIMISGFSTLLFNGNPLQRYDGYYILVDWLGIPGLGMRSAQYIAGLFRRQVMGDNTTRMPVTTLAERWWFLLYGPTSFFYRLSLMLLIAFYVAERYPGVGMIMAGWSLIGYFATPIVGLFRFVQHSGNDLAQRAGWALGGLGLGLVLLLFAVPAPRSVVLEGVIAMPDTADIRPQVGGQLAEVLPPSGSVLHEGDPVARLTEPTYVARYARDTARVAELRAARSVAGVEDPGRAAVLAEQVRRAEQGRDEAAKDLDSLTVRSPANGIFLLARPNQLFGRYVMRGETIATIWDGARAEIRAIAAASDIADLRNLIAQGGGYDVPVRPGWNLLETLRADVVDMVPQASTVLPSSVLAVDGGGPYAVTHEHDSPLRVEEPVFQLTLRPRVPLPVTFLNGRVHVRFALPAQPIGIQIWRKARLVFLRRLHA